MGSVQSCFECPQCEFPEAIQDYDYKAHLTFEQCPCCGRWRQDEFEDPDTFVTRIHRGYGCLRYRIKEAIAQVSQSLSSQKDFDECEKWLRESLADRVVVPEDSYLIRWHDELGILEIVLGNPKHIVLGGQDDPEACRKWKATKLISAMELRN